MRHILYSVSTLAVIGGGFASSADAQNLGLSFGADGRLVAGYTNQVPGADIFFFGDATARLSLNRTPLGFELGVFGLANVVDTPHETYGTLTWDFARGGRLFVGVPRPAYDSFAVSAAETMLPSLGVSRTGTTRSLATYGAMFAGFLPYGIRYESKTDKLRFAVSVDTVPNSDRTIAGAGLSVPIGNLTFETAIELAWGAGSDIAGKAQLKGTFGGVNGGVGLYWPGTVGGTEVLEAFASFDPAERITLGAVVQIPLRGNDDPTVGVAAQYALSSSAGISVGMLKQPGAETGYSALLDWRF